MEWIGLFIIIIIVAVVYGDSKNKEIEKTVNDRLEYYLKYKKGVNYTKEYINKKFTDAILLNENDEQITFLTNNLEDIYIFDYEDIAGAEVVKDGETISKTSRGSQLGRAVLGGILAGNTGALIGGLSGSTKQEEKIHSIDLKATTDSFNTPSVTVNFFKDTEVSDIKLPKYSDNLEISVEEIDRWYNILNIIVRRNGKNNELNSENISPNKVEESDYDLNSGDSTSLEQLDKLVALYKEGFLTKEEYDVEKKKIINIEPNSNN